MSRLEKMIDDMCPDGVVFRPLWSLTAWDKKFNAVDRSCQTTINPHNYLLAADLKALEVEGGNVKLLTTSISDLFTTEEMAGENLKEGEIVSIPWGGNAVVQYYKGKYVTADNRIATSLDTSVLDNKYLYYYMSNKQEEIASFYRGSGIKHPDMSKVLGLNVPVPPLEVQREIVRILDNFTLLTAELTTELTAELTARKKQYDYYKDALLPFETDDVEWKPLGDISTIVRGASPRPIKKYITEDESGVNWIKIGDVSPEAKYITQCAEKITSEGAKRSRFVKPGDFILSNSMSFGRPYILQIEGCIHDGWLAISDFDKYVSPDYLYHVLTSNHIQRVMMQKASFGGAVQNLNADIVRSIEIPIPSLKEQLRTVSVLDRFSLLCTDITTGLPAEIEARQKQYEYYRDKLLTFKELS